MAEASSVMLVLTTEGDAMRAKALARALLERRLVACVSLQSTDALYHWEGEIHSDCEVQLLMKTTADRLEAVLKKKGMTVFNRIDHAKGAKSVGNDLRPTELIIFGNPKIGSVLMGCAQTIAIDLPQKALVWQDGGGQVWLSYNEPTELAKRHRLPGCEKVIQKVTGALGNFAKAATMP